MIKNCTINFKSGFISGYIYKVAGENSSNAVIFLLPLGEERKGTLRLYHESAVTLQKYKYNSIIFDYPCTGDSSGSFNNLKETDIIESIRLTVDYLCSEINIKDINFISSRMSSIFACSYLKERDCRISKCIMIEPETKGANWLQECRRRSSFRKSSAAKKTSADMTYIDGFKYNKDFYDNLCSLSLCRSLNKETKYKILQISHRSTPSQKIKKLAEDINAELTCLKFQPFWLESGRIDYNLIINYLKKKVAQI